MAAFDSEDTDMETQDILTHRYFIAHFEIKIEVRWESRTARM